MKLVTDEHEYELFETTKKEYMVEPPLPKEIVGYVREADDRPNTFYRSININFKKYTLELIK